MNYDSSTRNILGPGPQSINIYELMKPTDTWKSDITSLMSSQLFVSKVLVNYLNSLKDFTGLSVKMTTERIYTIEVFNSLTKKTIKVSFDGELYVFYSSIDDVYRLVPYHNNEILPIDLKKNQKITEVKKSTFLPLSWYESIVGYLTNNKVHVYLSENSYVLYMKGRKISFHESKNKGSVKYSVDKYFGDDGEYTHSITSLPDYPGVSQRCDYGPIVDLRNGSFFNDYLIFNRFMYLPVEKGIRSITIKIDDQSFDVKMLQNIFYMDWSKEYVDLEFVLQDLTMNLAHRFKEMVEGINTSDVKLQDYKNHLKNDDFTIVATGSRNTNTAKYLLYNNLMATVNLESDPFNKDIKLETSKTTKTAEITFVKIHLFKYRTNLLPYYVKINDNKILDYYRESLQRDSIRNYTML
jgi:hypothetical protein